MVCQESSYQEVSKAQSMTLYKFSREIHGEGQQPYDIYKVINAHRSMYNTFDFFIIIWYGIWYDVYEVMDAHRNMYYMYTFDYFHFHLILMIKSELFQIVNYEM